MRVLVLVEVDALEPASDCLPFYDLQLLKGKQIKDNKPQERR